MDTSPIRVLHVDDDPSLLELTGEFLEREDDRLVLETATSADEGLDQIGDRPPDCIVSDYDMPGKNGIEFLRAVRKVYPGLPFILFTGKGSESVASDAMAAGVTDYLRKGPSTEQYELLANRITNAVQAQRTTQEVTRQAELMRLTEFAGDAGGWELDLETEELMLTDGTRRLINLSPDESLGLEEAIDLYHPDDRDEVRAALDQVAETGEQVQDTWRIRPNGGGQRFLEVTVTPVRSNGEVTMLRGAVNDVTERYERRQELEQIETLFQHAQDPLFLIDVDNEFTVERVNSAWEEATDLAPDLTHGKPIADLLGKKQASAVREKYRECVRRREPLEYEERPEFGDDPTYWETRIAPVVIDGAVEYIAGSTRNVTEKRDRQRELRRLRQAIDGANVPITLADPSQEDNPLVYVNDAYEELTGYSQGEALGRNCRYLQGEDTDPEKVAALREAIEDEEPVTVELRNYRKDGSEFWNHLTVTPIYDDDGHLVRYLGTQQDVTERRERERELRAEQEFTEQALDTLDDLFYVLNSDGTIRRYNEQFAAVTGYDPAKLDGLAATELFHKDDQQTIADAIETTLKEGKTTVETDLLTADGKRVPYEFTGARLTDTDGDVTGLVGVGRNLTERRQREQRIQQLIKTTPGCVVELDAEGGFVFANERAEEVLGLDSEGVTGRTYNDPKWDLQDPSGEPIADEGLPFSRIRDMGEPVYGEQLDIAWPDGTRKLLLANGAPVFGEDGSFESAIFSLIDITDRKERQRELVRTKAVMSKMEQLAGIGAWEYNPENNAPMNTAGMKRIYGVEPAAELTLEEAFEFSHPADRDRLMDRFEACLETGGSYEIDVRVLTAEGDEKWVTASGERVELQDGRSVVRGYVQDITARKERLARLEQVETLFENVQDMLFVIKHTDGKFVVRRVNEAFERATGRSGRQLQGKTPRQIFGPERSREIEQRFRQCLDTGEPLDYEETVEVGKFPKKDTPDDGKHTYWETRIAPVVTGNDNEWIVGATRDINERKRRQQKLKQQNERLEEFASVVSHDLRNPLNLAEGRLELARADCDSAHLDDIAGALDRMDALIEDLLTLARGGGRVGSTESVPLSTLAEGCWEVVPEENATLTVETDRTVSADRSRLGQLLENLFANAVEHGGEDVTVRVGGLTDGFFIADDGVGIPEGEREDIFEPGYSTAEGGTGFGLRIVKRVAEAHGWDIRVTDSDDDGAQFEITGVDTPE